jgi:hypothetical protein
MTNEQADAIFKELTKNEVAFLEDEGDGVKNEHGAYCYQSMDGSHLIALDYYLMHYKKWLIEKGIVKELP